MYAIASASAIGDSLSADCVVRTGTLRPVQAVSYTHLTLPTKASV